MQRTMRVVSFPALSDEQQELFRLIEDTREHVFITGRAGTGKSTLLQYFAWHTEKQIAICAPTGVAALNVEGQTIHSLFRLPIGLIAEGEIEQNDATRRILNAIDTLVIDEVSMVNADLMDGMDRALRQARGRRAEPFGGVQVVMFGDPYQLAPVPPRGTSCVTCRITTAHSGSSTRRCGRARRWATPTASWTSAGTAHRCTCVSSCRSIGSPTTGSKPC